MNAHLLKLTLMTRKLLWFTVQKGPAFTTSIEKPETDLTVEMLQSCASPFRYLRIPL